MAGGFFALLDDIAVLAKAAAATVDDIAAGAMKASAKTVGVVIDDAAITPQYVRGISAKRELSVVKRIALGSLRNKFLIILPTAMIFSQFAPWVLPILLIVGGTYLSFEGAEKVLAWMGKHHSEHKNIADKAETVEEFESKLISSAVRTDLILSTEIMIIALSSIEESSFWMRLGMLSFVAAVMTIAVYGTVALLVKVDDIGLHLAEKENKFVARAGLAAVKSMPTVFSLLTIVGTVAMLWVGGHILASSSHELGFHLLYDALHYVEELVHSAGPVITWFADTTVSAIFGLIAGLAVVYVISAGSVVLHKLRS